MTRTNIIVPDLPESITDATIIKWYKKEGDRVICDEHLIDLETDKVMLEITSPCNGILSNIIEKKDKIVQSQQILGQIIKSDSNSETVFNTILSDNTVLKKEKNSIKHNSNNLFQFFSPSIRRTIKIYENNPLIFQESKNPHTMLCKIIIDYLEKKNKINNNIPDIMQNDVNQNDVNQNDVNQNDVNQNDVNQNDVNQNDVNQNDVNQNDVNQNDVNQNDVNQNDVNQNDVNQNDVNQNDVNQNDVNQNDVNIKKRVKMTRLRQRIAERLLETKNNTAMLTTFNEVNMQPIILLRKKYSKNFEQAYGTKIGFMSFYVKAVVEALKKFPAVNASIDNNDIIYYKNFDISIAISTPRGLITPVLRSADTLSMSDIEKKIKEFSLKGFQNTITIQELIGGNFTITNGGVFGSLISTPIINPPQTAILGIHLIKDRPMAVDGKVKILPMMYLALSYDHRLIDGKEAVSFLLTIKNILEDFTSILICI